MSGSAASFDTLKEEISKFPFLTYLDDLELSDGLIEGSIKNAIVIACSDMGFFLPYVCSAPDLRLFLFQNFGHQFSSGGVLETIVKAAVEHVIVYGHGPCEYTKFRAGSICRDATGDLLHTPERLHQFKLCSDALESNSEELFEGLAKYNVLLELKNMLAHPLLESVLAQGRLKVHGWFYKSAEQQLEIYDPERGAFTAARCKFSEQTFCSVPKPLRSKLEAE